MAGTPSEGEQITRCMCEQDVAMGDKSQDRHTQLNAICPYFTMFPLEFPYAILAEHAREGEWTLDPFCGRGATNYASRLLGLPSVGVDSSPVAAALTAAKLVNTTPAEIVEAAQGILNEERCIEPPTGDFWA